MKRSEVSIHENDTSGSCCGSRVALWLRRKFSVVVGVRHNDCRYPDSRWYDPYPPCMMEQWTDGHDAEGCPCGDIAAKHAGKMRIPPEHLFFGAMCECPGSVSGDPHTDATENHRGDTEMLHERRPYRSENSEERAGSEGKGRGEPVESSRGFFALIGSLLPQYAIAGKSRIEAEDGDQSQKQDGAVDRHHQCRKS